MMDENVIKPLHVVGAPYALKKGQPQPEPGTIAAWALQKSFPEWLCAAMQAGRPINAIYTEVEFHALAEQIAGLPLVGKVL